MATVLPLVTLFILPAILGLLMPSCLAENIMYSGDTLSTGHALILGDYQFIMQYDCNLVLYESGHVLWASNTDGRGKGCFLSMQSDGDLVVYDGNKKAVWRSNTKRGPGNYVCILQRDRNVVVYGGALWATGTNLKGSNGVVITNNVTATATTVATVTGEHYNRKVAKAW